MKFKDSKTFKADKGGAVSKAASYDAPVIDDENRSITFVISTGDADRDNDVIDQSGWELDNYKANPVVCWSHNTDELPVGKCTAIGVVNGKLTATVEFATYEKAETIFQLVKGGFLSATSVGFMPSEWEYSDDREQGVDFFKQELREFSIVTIPCNPNALIVPDKSAEPATEKQANADAPEIEKKNINNNRIGVERRKRLFALINIG